MLFDLYKVFMDAPAPFPLVAHPGHRPHADIAASVEFAFFDGDGGIWLEFCITGEVKKLALYDDAAQMGARVDGLWEHCCAEIFIMDDAGPAYVELNYSFDHQWAAYQFTAFRENGQDMDREIAPRCGVREREGSVSLFAQIPSCYRPTPTMDGDWIVSTTMVLEELSGHKSYWALRHPPGQPNFHHRDCFLGLI